MVPYKGEMAGSDMTAEEKLELDTVEYYHYAKFKYDHERTDEDIGEEYPSFKRFMKQYMSKADEMQLDVVEFNSYNRLKKVDKKNDDKIAERYPTFTRFMGDMDGNSIQHVAEIASDKQDAGQKETDAGHDDDGMDPENQLGKKEQE